MTLIIILVALGLDYVAAGLERARGAGWFIRLRHALEQRLARYPLWDGILGLIGLLSIPLAPLWLALYLSHTYAPPLELLPALLVLVYCLAPEGLNRRLKQHIQAAAGAEVELAPDPGAVKAAEDEAALIGAALVEAHRRTFAVLFWFIVSGPLLALLYRLVERLHAELKDTQSGLADDTRLLLNILEWPSARLMVLGLALAGNLVEAVPDWKRSGHLSFSVNNEVLIKSGLGALQYQPRAQDPETEARCWIAELKALLDRSLIIWLALLGIMTLAGKLA